MTRLHRRPASISESTGPESAAERVRVAGSTDRRAAVTELFTLHYTPLVRMARFLVDDEESAEDVVMDAFASVYRRWQAIRDPQDAYRYLRSCVLNGSRSRLRRRLVRRSRGPLITAVDSDGDADKQRVERLAMLDSLRSLPLRQRQVLVLRYYMDLSEAQIAAELGISAGSVKTHTSRGLSALARELGDPR
jgi:RNA polymerase sigma-70 factor (sigma-E family)